MATQNKTYQPRVIRGRIELWAPYNNGEIAFAFPSEGPGTYRNVGAKILGKGQKVPHGDYTASLSHAAYCTDAGKESEFQNVREIMRNKWLWVFNINGWTENGVYVIQDLEALGRSQPLDVKDLEKRLKGGKELNWGGIRFSEDERVRFAPKESYRLGEHTSKSLAKDGFIIASCGVEGAEKLGEVSSKLKFKPVTYGVNVEQGQKIEQRVSALDELDDRLLFVGYLWDVDYDYGGSAFGVL